MHTDDKPDQQTPPATENSTESSTGPATESSKGIKRRKPMGTEFVLSAVLAVGVLLAVCVMVWSSFKGASKVPPSAASPTTSPTTSPTGDSQAPSITGKAQKVNVAPPGAWHLAFESDFSGAILDANVWATCYWFAAPGAGCSNNGNSNEEKEWYQPSQVKLSGGTLNLIAQHEPTEGSSAKGAPEKFSCRSGMVTTKPGFNFEYGYVQMVARLPYGNGLWPAFWLAASNKKWPPEVDIFEHWGSEANTGAYLHPLNGKRQGGRVQAISNLSKGWHTFTLSWTKNKLTWYIDDYLVFSTTTSIPRQDMYIIANVADTSTEATSCSGTMLVKSIKVWQP
jgi:beta-glucanase (GH16 family)